ncbi:hypothetical protein EIP91_012126 [Steccherinum ochraceum]|uniref:Glucose-methanol-choline oxidoreductase N-terminal domain-containing protein n=1 Tax=Steccherinum ochraceum TaxID=92696 RepID=A0A4V6N7B1_9APHY|nr:hypothetical protein EIP91_012126 [Steccherinum ochraceum]
MLATIDQVVGGKFDYVVVGGGTAGLTLAAKLSEDESKTVLVLEEGYDNLGDSEILRPTSYGSLFGKEKYSWVLRTVPQANANDRVFEWQRGRGLGGSTAINITAYSKPPADDVDAFGRLGSSGFDWETYNRIVSQIEGFVPPSQDAPVKSSLMAGFQRLGTNGPLKLSLPLGMSHMQVALQETMMNVGIPSAPDPFGGKPAGFAAAATTWDPESDTRSYAASAFYHPHEARTNLIVLTRAHVHRLVTGRSPVGKVRAMSVEFSHEGRKCSVHIGADVVLCAGALHSPKILELSGIGDERILNSLGIPVVTNLPGVGANAQEHISSRISFEVKQGCLSQDTNHFPVPLTLKSNDGASGDEPPQRLMLSFMAASLNMISTHADEICQAAKNEIESKWDSYPAGLQKQYEIQLERLDKNGVVCEVAFHPGLGLLSHFPHPPEPNKDYMGFSAVLLHPFSRGTIHVVSTDPTVPPEVDPHYFERDIDLQIVVEQLRFLRKVAATSPFKEMCVGELNPGIECDTDKDLREYIKNHFRTTWHTCSTCSMMSQELDGVVDSNFVVYDTENIRVADLSTMPLQVASHTQSMAYAIGAYAAEVMLSKEMHRPGST